MSSIFQFSTRELAKLGAEIRCESVKTLHLTNRTLRALDAAEISSLGKVVDEAARGFGKLPAMGSRCYAELEEVLSCLSDAAVGTEIDWIGFAQSRGFIVLPKESEAVGKVGVARLLPDLILEAVAASFKQNAVELTEKFLLAPVARRPELKDIAARMQITKQAVSLIKAEIVTCMQGALLTDDYTRCHFRFRRELTLPIRRLEARIRRANGRAFSLQQWHRFVREVMPSPAADVSRAAGFLLELLGYRPIHPDKRRFGIIVLPRSRIGYPFYRALDRIRRLLREDYPDGVSHKVLLARLSLGTVIRPEEVPVLIESIRSVRLTRGKRYRISRVELISDKLERLFLKKRRPLSLDQIRGLRITGRDGRPVSKDSLSHIMSSDSRFSSIGKTGIWTLTEWKLETRKVTDVAAAILGRRSGPMTEMALYSLISIKRPVSFESIGTLLRDDGRFERLAARTWGLKVH